MPLLKIESADMPWLEPLTESFRARHNCGAGQILDHAQFCQDYGISRILTKPLPGHEGIMTDLWFEFDTEVELLLFVMRYKQ